MNYAPEVKQLGEVEQNVSKRSTLWTGPD